MTEDDDRDDEPGLSEDDLETLDDILESQVQLVTARRASGLTNTRATPTLFVG